MALGGREASTGALVGNGPFQPLEDQASDRAAAQAGNLPQPGEVAERGLHSLAAHRTP